MSYNVVMGTLNPTHSLTGTSQNPFPGLPLGDWVRIKWNWPRWDGRQIPWPLNSSRTSSCTSRSSRAERGGVHDNPLEHGAVCTPHMSVIQRNFTTRNWHTRTISHSAEAGPRSIREFCIHSRWSVHSVQVYGVHNYLVKFHREL